MSNRPPAATLDPRQRVLTTKTGPAATRIRAYQSDRASRTSRTCRPLDRPGCPPSRGHPALALDRTTLHISRGQGSTTAPAVTAPNSRAASSRPSARTGRSRRRRRFACREEGAASAGGYPALTSPRPRLSSSASAPMNSGGGRHRNCQVVQRRRGLRLDHAGRALQGPTARGFRRPSRKPPGTATTSPSCCRSWTPSARSRARSDGRASGRNRVIATVARPRQVPPPGLAARGQARHRTAPHRARLGPGA